MGSLNRRRLVRAINLDAEDIAKLILINCVRAQEAGGNSHLGRNQFMGIDITEQKQEFRRLFATVLPMVRPPTGAFLMITFPGTWNNFIRPQVVLQSLDKQPLSVAIAQLKSVYSQDYGMLMAGTVISITRGCAHIMAEVPGSHVRMTEPEIDVSFLKTEWAPQTPDRQEQFSRYDDNYLSYRGQYTRRLLVHVNKIHLSSRFVRI